ncbi:sigma-70 family RNA polymerase sigma factor [Pseudomonas sp. NPDC089401]|uniref:sigma-70 family RNA polymerase sigma factor n=1 Tax=Pseudomonas sp. NPDC089401 TaxID=3364462 RepID=UPI003830E7C0
MPETSSSQSLHQLYLDNHGWLQQWLRRKTGCREQAADLAQDTFMRLLGQRKLEELKQPKAYLSRIARSLMIDQFRRRQLEQAYLQSLAALPEPVEISAQERSSILETLLQIDRMLDGLQPRTRTIFLLAQLDGLSHVAIARQLNVSANTVSKHFVRAMAHCLLLIGD